MARGKTRFKKNDGPQKGLTTAISSRLRSRSSFTDTIINVHRDILSYPAQKIGTINSFLMKNSFFIPERSFGESLNIDSRHLDQLTNLYGNRNIQVNSNYLHLVSLYILSNFSRVNSWMEFDQIASSFLFEENPEEIKSRLIDLPSIDQQSLSSLKLYAALHSYSDSTIRQYFEKNLSSSWTKSTLLYPLIYYYVNLPMPQAFDQMLAHVIPDNKTSGIERNIVRFLIDGDASNRPSLAARCYLGLLSHPYDALDYVTTYFEQLIAGDAAIENSDLETLARLSAMFPSHRLSRLLESIQRQTIDLRKAVCSVHGLDEKRGADSIRLIKSIVDLNGTKPIGFKRDTLSGALVALRWERYPLRADYDIINVYRQRFAVLNAGKIVDYISRSLFLFEREEPAAETLTSLRGLLITSTLTPFLLTGPGGLNLINLGIIRARGGTQAIKDLVAKELGGGAKDRADRVWIKAANWSLIGLQRDGRVAEWAKQARARFPIWIQPRYLSGLDWFWLARVIEQVGVIGLRGTADGIFVLFMRQIEQNMRESVPLRVAVEPVVRSSDGPKDFFYWLAREFGQDARAFVRFYLTPDTLLKLKLADSYAPALATRISLLSLSAKEFGFADSILTEDDLIAEQDSLTATLSRMSIGAQQFEIPWLKLTSDAVTRNSDAFDVHITMKGAASGTVLQSEAIRESRYPFSNGAVEEYEARNKQWPMLLVIAGVIDTFLSHPTSGIEAILSVRIRHDAFRREFSASFQNVVSGNITGVMRSSVKELSLAFESSVFRTIQQWLDGRMHTYSRGKPRAFFNFVPTKSEMSHLIEQAEFSEDLQHVVKLVFAWIQPRLEAQLCQARSSLADELGPSLATKISATADDLIRAGRDTGEVRRVAQAIGGAVDRRNKDIEEWFKIPPSERSFGLTFGEVWKAVEQRFASEQTAKRLTFHCSSVALSSRRLSPDQIRHLYDLLSELVRNAVKHAHIRRTRVRVSRLRKRHDFVVISNTAEPKESYSEVVGGHPFLNIHDALFGEGKSGTKKIAALTASLISEAVSIHVVRKSNSFHIILPVAALGNWND